MTLSALALIGATIVFSSFLSGVFGMAGGMVLLGVLLNYFDVPTGMIFFPSSSCSPMVGASCNGGATCFGRFSAGMCSAL